MPKAPKGKYLPQEAARNMPCHPYPYPNPYPYPFPYHAPGERHPGVAGRRSLQVTVAGCIKWLSFAASVPYALMNLLPEMILAIKHY